MTNEEIIKQICEQYTYENYPVEEAMDSARKDEAVEFGKWVLERRTYCLEYSIEELYEQYSKSK